MATAELGQDLAMALDGALFARAAGLSDPDPWQVDLLRSPAHQKILLMSRQAGKSTVSSILGLHMAIFQPGALVLCLAPALRQSQELFRKIKDAYAALGPDVCPVTKENALELEFEHGSRIVCLPGKEATIRGFSGAALLLVDEASRVPDELYQAVRPMLAVSGGKIVLLSTPFGQRGFFYKEWAEGGPTWERVKVRAVDVPRIPAAWLAEEHARIGDFWFRQEYDCDFVATEDQVFAYDLVMGAVDATITPLFPQGDDSLWLASSA